MSEYYVWDGGGKDDYEAERQRVREDYIDRMRQSRDEWRYESYKEKRRTARVLRSWTLVMALMTAATSHLAAVSGEIATGWIWFASSALHFVLLVPAHRRVKRCTREVRKIRPGGGK